MPAAAVIPAPIAYIKVVAVKKLVVGFLDGSDRSDTQVWVTCIGLLPSLGRVCRVLLSCLGSRICDRLL